MKWFSMEHWKKKDLPIHHTVKLSKVQCTSSDEEINTMSQVSYASAIGSIMCAMICTRPNVAYALSMVSRYQGNPSLAHWTAMKKILKYLKKKNER